MTDTCLADEKKQDESGAPPLVERNCAVCGAAFMPQRRNQVVCSDECRYRRSLQTMAKANKKRRERDLSPRACKVCGNVFTPKRASEVCCSPACKGEYMLVRSREGCLKRYYANPECHPNAAIKQRLANVESVCALLLEEIDSLKQALDLDCDPPAPEADSDPEHETQTEA